MTPINMADDALQPPPGDMARALADLSAGVEADYYGQGGAVAAFERQVAAFLGKERAMMFPTGTLGNQLVLQRLTGGAPARVIVHRQSHLFNDAGDNLSQLSGLTMVPLDGDGAGYSAALLRAEIRRTASARVAARIGAVTVESPSRRMSGRQFGPELDSVIAVARDAGLPLFLDGARMLIQCAYTGQSPKDMAAPFDVVYLSLYKYLRAPFGCVIAGPSSVFEDLHHDRRRFGGSLFQMWPAAVLASHALPQQDKVWSEARRIGKACLPLLAEADRAPTVYADGTNVIEFECGADPKKVVEAGAREGLKLMPPTAGKLSVKVNETWLGHDPRFISDRLITTLRASAVN